MLPSCTSRLPDEPDVQPLEYPLTRFCSQAIFPSHAWPLWPHQSCSACSSWEQKTTGGRGVGARRGACGAISSIVVPCRGETVAISIVASHRATNRRGDTTKQTLRPPMSLWFRSWIGVRGEGKGKEKRSCSAILSPRIAGTRIFCLLCVAKSHAASEANDCTTPMSV